MEDRKVLRWTLYIGFGIGTFLFSMISTFPTSVAAQQVSTQLKKALPRNMNVELGGVGLTFPFGVEATDVKLKMGRNSTAPTYEFDSVRIEPALSALVQQQMGGSATVEIGGGQINAKFGQGGAGQVEFKASADGVNLHSIPALSSSTNLPLMGTVGLEAEGEWNGSLAKSSFDASLTTANLGMGATKVFSVSLPTISLGNVNLKVSNKQGKMELTEFAQVGGNFSVQAIGNVRLKQNFYSSTLDLCFKLRGDDAFLKENPKLKASMDLGTAMLHKDGEGYLHAPVKGPIRAMRPPRSPKPCKGL